MLLGECQYPEISSIVFDKDNSSASYRKEIAHMARYYRLHLGSFLAMEFAKELSMYRQRYNGNNNNNRFESVIELYEAGCADYIFNFVIDCDSFLYRFEIATHFCSCCSYCFSRSTDRWIGLLREFLNWF